MKRFVKCYFKILFPVLGGKMTTAKIQTEKV